MPHRASPLVALDGSRLWPLRGAEDGEVQHAAAEADSILDLQQLRLRMLRASAGEDVLMADCMFELARRLHGRARYGEAEELYRECLRICLDLSFPELQCYSHSFGFASCFLQVPHEGNWCRITSRMFLHVFAINQSRAHVASKASHGKGLENSKVH